jgi:hypothetical protein
LESQRLVMVVGSGKFINDSSVVLCELEKHILKCLVPFKYLITLIAKSMCPCDGFLQYFASIDVTVAISGLVDILNQFRELTMVCICRVSRR